MLFILVDTTVRHIATDIGSADKQNLHFHDRKIWRANILDTSIKGICPILTLNDKNFRDRLIPLNWGVFLNFPDT